MPSVAVSGAFSMLIVTSDLSVTETTKSSASTVSPTRTISGLTLASGGTVSFTKTLKKLYVSSLINFTV